MEVSSPNKLSKTSSNFIASKNLNKTFLYLNKTLLGETGCLSNLYYLLAAQVSSFLIHILITGHRVVS